MKKLKILLTILLSCVVVMSGCGETSIQYSGAYWDDTPSGFSKFTEVAEYSVSVVDKTASNSSQIKNDYVQMVIDDSSNYVTTLSYDKTVTENVYTYKTELTVKGKYVLLETGEEKPFEDSLITESRFLSLANNFKPISVKKYSPSTTLMIFDAEGPALVPFTYEYEINYEGDTAKTVYKAKSLKENAEYQITENTFNKYSKNEYIDNDLILLMLRAFNFSDNYTQNFTTIDVVTQKLTKMLAYTGKTLNKSDFQTTFTYNGQETPFNMASRVFVSINEDFTGSVIENYYAPDQKAPYHHVMLKSYSALNNNLGYLAYTLKSVEYSY